MYQLAADPLIMVGEALRSTPPVIHFPRQLNVAELASWDLLQAQVGQPAMNLADDVVSWDLLASRKFSVKSMYNRLTEVPTLDIARSLWKARVPLKIKIFLWQMFRNRLPTADNVAKRNGPRMGLA